MTFAASANCAVYQGAVPVFCDVERDTLLIDAQQAEKKVTSKTRAIIAVDYAGQPCDYNSLKKTAKRHGFVLVADACHSLGGESRGRKVGTLADLNVFSFHPVKHITTGEGGMIATDNARYAARARIFRNHGIDSDHHRREKTGSWFYEMTDLGYNYRITDFQCALGISQLKKMTSILKRRRSIAAFYDQAFAGLKSVRPLVLQKDVNHAYHLYVLRLDPAAAGMDRDEFFIKMRAQGIGVNVHYIPVHLHPFYRKKFKTKPGMCPRAEEAYKEIISIPLFPTMKRADVTRVVKAVKNLLS
ncbi:MAG: DegT/DnrJ/EryC1/StrS family aminotransferase, partial [Candidatus Omnitrophota bacterium]